MSAAIPQSVVQKSGRSNSGTEAKGPLSHGRGGAGNMGSSVADFDRPSLDTPTLKGEVYTTGRGGSGNMAKNNDPEAARRAQDVIAHPRRESGSSTHVGRGGAANIFHPSAIAGVNGGSYEHAIEGSIDEEREVLAAEKKQNEKGWADRGKEWLMSKK